MSKQLLMESAWTSAVVSGLLAPADVNSISPLPPSKYFLWSVEHCNATPAWVDRYLGGTTPLSVKST